MNGMRALRVIAYVSISIGVGILSRGAWGFVIFGVLALADSFVFPYRPVPPDTTVVREHLVERGTD